MMSARVTDTCPPMPLLDNRISKLGTYIDVAIIVNGMPVTTFYEVFSFQSYPHRVNLGR